MAACGKVADSLLTLVEPVVPSSGSKVTIVGVGQVGMACAFAILTQVSYPTAPKHSFVIGFTVLSPFRTIDYRCEDRKIKKVAS
jgi:hypothetical protein